ncbi:MAG: SCP2 sterol-binding domain-containing protein [Spirochaetes bacterium]|nr:SCP2 sterol-binding domain-containing protein [Spirochaetota bacterium]
MDEFLIKTGFALLGRAAGAVSKYDQDVAGELSHWKEGFTVKLEVFASGAEVALQVKNGKYHYLKQPVDKCDLRVILKNKKSAAKIILARLSLAEANAQNRIIIEGNTMDAMRYVRTMKAIMAYLYPFFMLRNITEKMPRRTIQNFKNKIRIIFIGVIAGKEV